MYKFIQWSDIVVRGSQSGVKKAICPACSHERKNKKDPCLYVNFTSGVAKCYHCDALSFREQTERTERTYQLPPQEWQNFTNLSDAMVKYCRDERKIRQETLIHFGITEEKHYQPAKQKELNNIVFNYFEGSKLVNKKYRSGSKDFTQTKGGKPIMYNINSVIGSDEVYIVEGEFDVLAMYEAGVTNCISVPNGANDNDDYWINSMPYLKDVKRFIIATDTDEKGIDVRNKIAQRLGRFRCTFLEFEYKDANGELISGQIASTLKKIKRFPVSGTFSVDDLYDDIMELYDKGIPETIKLKGNNFTRLNASFSVMRGHLVTGTGMPSHGKSEFTEYYTLSLVKDYGMKLSFFSPEHSPMQLHQSKFIQKVIGKPFFDNTSVPRVTPQEIERYKHWAHERIYLTAPEQGEKPKWSWLFEKFKEQIFTFGIDIFVIDAFNKLLFDSGGGKDAIDQVLTELTAFAQTYHVIIFLIAHPTKMKKDTKGNYEIPNLYDISGSADFRNQTHDGFVIHRIFKNEITDGYTTFMNLKTKFAFQGEIGAQVNLGYDVLNGRYFELGQLSDKTDWTKPIEEKQSEMFANFYEPKIVQNEEDEFRMLEEDVPF